MTAMQAVFLVTGAVALISGVMVVSVRRIMHAALWLILTLLCVAVIFALLESGFFAIVQVVVYIGAIAILIIFAVMLTRAVVEDTRSQVNRGWGWALAAALALFGGLLAVLSTWNGFMQSAQILAGSPEDLTAFGKALAAPDGYVIPFETASVLLLAALVGGIYIASERRREE